MSTDSIRFGLFAGVDEVESFSDGETVFTAGDVADHLYVVRSGSVALTTGDVTLETLGPGEMFGEMAVIDGSPRSADAVATSDCVLVPIDKARFRALIQHTPFFGENVMRLIAGRLRRSTPSP